MKTKLKTNKHDEDNHNYENNYNLLLQCDYCSFKQKFDYIARGLNNIKETGNMLEIPDFVTMHHYKELLNQLCDEMKGYE